MGHPTYAEMVAQAIIGMKDRRGSTGFAIKKFILSQFDVADSTITNRSINLALKKGVANGTLLTARGHAGTFRNSQEAKKAAGLKVKAVEKKKAMTPAKNAVKNTAAKEAKETPSKAKETPAKAKKSKAEAKKTPVKAKKTPVKAKKTPVKAKKIRVKAKKTPVKAKKTSIKAKKTPVKAKKSKIEAEKTPIKAKKPQVAAKMSTSKPIKKPAKAMIMKK